MEPGNQLGIQFSAGLRECRQFGNAQIFELQAREYLIRVSYAGHTLHPASRQTLQNSELSNPWVVTASEAPARRWLFSTESPYE